MQRDVGGTDRRICQDAATHVVLLHVRVEKGVLWTRKPERHGEGEKGNMGRIQTVSVREVIRALFSDTRRRASVV